MSLECCYEMLHTSNLTLMAQIEVIHGSNRGNSSESHMIGVGV